MDTSKEYIKMCEKAEEIQIEKYKQGFVEGDFIWNGEKVCVCGIDWIEIKNFFQKTRQLYFMFAILEDLKVEFMQEYPMDTVKVKVKRGRYTIKELGGIGLWLPRQDQLQEILVQFDKYKLEPPAGGIPRLNFEFHHFTLGKIKFYQYSMEQLWLAFMMSELSHKKWDGEKWTK